MKIKLVAALFCAVLLSACAVQPIYSVPDQAIATNTKSASLKDVHDAITRGAMRMGWIVQDKGPNAVVATIDLRTHHAAVEITYNTKSYSIAYKESNNLNYDGQNIHRAYNGWIHNLQGAINQQLNGL